MRKPLSEHQQRNLRYIVECQKNGATVAIGMLNMSVLAALMRRGLIRIVPSTEGLGEYSQMVSQEGDSKA